MPESFTAAEVRALRQSWPMPSDPQPIVIIGAGEIVTDAHLPAYRKAGWPVAGIYDIEGDAARALARRFEIDTVYDSFAAAVAVPDAGVDIAVPATVLAEVGAHDLGEGLDPHDGGDRGVPTGRRGRRRAAAHDRRSGLGSRSRIRLEFVAGLRKR